MNHDIKDIVPSLTGSLDTLLAPWRALCAKADGFFEQVAAHHGGLMVCGPSCDGCCQDDLELLPLEALAVLRGLDRLEPEQRREVQLRAESPGPPCAMLSHGLCQLYDHRPLICRTHGLPVLYNPADLDPDDPDEAELSWCPLNFTEASPPGDAVLRGSVLYAALAVADRLTLAQPSLAEVSPDRVTIGALAAGGWAALVSPNRR